MKMFVNFFIIILFMSAIKIYVQTETIDCEYNKNTWAFWSKKIYYCSVKNSDIFSNKLKVKIDGSIGQHLNGFSSNDQVEGISIGGATNMTNFPSNIENVFPNLIAIGIYMVNLTHVTSEDLKPFTKLKVLYLIGNHIESIPENLFIHNQDLEVIRLDFNKIQDIDKNAFIHLKKLRTLHLFGNTCTSLGNADNRDAVLKTIKKIEQDVCNSDIKTDENSPEKEI
ncbi:hypothetical protein PVAND_009496 [Polypedilum vanderplanki]|uniref:Leucine-rich repeat protein n=1 Tax=Polypedilum vanderplanki TaxID=319348 RepID=A0A9J6CCR7_POLVA|nr:hypothetical protein PVAND_009496 [Polypedilum vanderplanki]